MEITLRKASKLRSKIDNRLAELSAEIRTTNIAFEVSDNDALAILNTEAERFIENLSRYSRLSGVRGYIRNLIGNTNFTNGVNAKLNKLDVNKSFLGVVKSIASQAEVRLSDEKVESRIQSSRKQLETGRGYADRLTLPFLPQASLDALNVTVRDAQKEIELLTEELEAVNASSRITLGEDALAILESEDLI